MSSMGASGNIPVFLVMIVAGCTPQAISGWEYRNGPDPAMPFEKRVKPTLDNQTRVMNAFLENVQGRNVDPSRVWYYATIQGFNFVDTECSKYLDELYALDHGRERAKSAIDSTGLLVNAILAAEPVSTVTMAIVTQAFGLASKYSDTFANSYLFSGHSSTVHNVVEKMQVAYRAEVMSDPDAITSEPEAYLSIRNYLELCLPPTIEAKIEEKLAGVKATAAPPSAEEGARPMSKKAASGQNLLSGSWRAGGGERATQTIAPLITLE
jgi:hypothetical protein